MTEYQKSVIIQLREETAQGKSLDNAINGVYETNISPSIQIDDGDEISLKSAFIDSVSTNSGKIIITPEESENFSISFYHYIKNNDTNNKEFNDTAPTSTPQPDGLHYFLCDTNENASDQRQLNSIVIKEEVNYGVRYWGDTDLVFSYVPPTQTTAEPKSYITFHIGRQYGDSDKVTISASKGFSGMPLRFNGNFGVQLPADKNDYKKLREEKQVNPDSADFSDNIAVDSGSVRTPHQFEVNFKVPAGSYDPDELARTITDQFSDLDIGSFQNKTGYSDGIISINNFLMTTPFQFNTKFPQPSGRVFYVSETGQDFYRYTAGNYLSGSSNFGLQFDEGLQKFKFTLINNPYLSPQGDISVQGIQHGTTGNFFIANKNSGIMFSNLSPSSVWYEKMGFNNTPNNPITNHYVTNPPKDFNADVKDQSLPRFDNVKEGVNVTGSYAGLDVAVPKANAGDPHGQQLLTAGSINAKSLNQNIIYANKSLQQQQYTYGYYMLEVGMGGITQELQGKNIYSNKIQSIIGRYYSNNSFTSAYNEGSIPYIHKGQSVKLNKFNVRILKDDGEVADDIGDNNTIFLELVKNTKKTLEPLPITLEEFEEITNKNKK